jgi:hypothetical protein
MVMPMVGLSMAIASRAGRIFQKSIIRGDKWQAKKESPRQSKGQQTLASQDFFLFAHLPEDSVELSSIFSGDVSLRDAKDLHLHNATGEIDGDLLSRRDLLSGLGLMAVDRDDAAVASHLGQRASLDQSTFGQE